MVIWSVAFLAYVDFLRSEFLALVILVGYALFRRITCTSIALHFT